MTVAVTQVKHVYDADGSNRNWSYSFPVISTAHIKIYVTDDLNNMTEVDANFTIDTVNSRVIYPTVASGLDALPEGYRLTLVRISPQTQATQIKNQGTIALSTLEAAYDKLTYMVQENSEQISRSIKFPIYETPSTTDTDEFFHDVMEAKDATLLAKSDAQNAATSAVLSAALATDKATAAATSATAAAASAASSATSALASQDSADDSYEAAVAAVGAANSAAASAVEANTSAANVGTYIFDAQTAAANAVAAAASASTASTSAATSATAAAASASAASASASSSLVNANNAQTSANNAASYESAVLTYASQANTSRNQAALYASNANTSATDAAASAAAAATSETNAANSATAAAASASSAATSATNAASSATAAATSASSAATSATAAATSATSAATSASNAATSATNASASATSASTSASNAATSATSASNSASAASTSASNAATSETNAANSASSASTSATNAANSASSAASSASAITSHIAAESGIHGATSSNTAGKIVSRDGSGNFSANVMSGTVKGGAIIGTSSTASNNVRTHRAGTALIQFLPADDSTAEGTLAATLAKQTLRLDTYLSGSKPAFGNAGRLIYVTDLATVYVDSGTSWDPASANVTLLQNSIDNHINATSGAHAATAISVTAVGAISSGNVQAALEEIQTDASFGVTNSATANTAINNHISNSTGAHAASAISVVPTGNLSSTDVQSGLQEHQNDINSLTTDLSTATNSINTHLANSSGAHAASAISVIAGGNLSSTNAQAALTELQSDIDTRALTSTLTAHTNDQSTAHGATSLNTVGKIVARDGSGNFSAGTITATLNGNASTATFATNASAATTANNVSGTVTIDHGGTGATDATTAFTNLAPAATIVGQVPFWNGSAYVAQSYGLVRNYILNSNFDFWQRNNSSIATSGYLADRWIYAIGGATGATATQDTTVPSNGLSKYSLKIIGTNLSASTGALRFTQRIESAMARQLKGKTITLSFWLNTSTNWALTQAGGSYVQFATPSASDNFTTTTAQSTSDLAVTVNGSYAQFSFTVNTSAWSNLDNGLQIDIRLQRTSSPGGTLTASAYLSQVVLNEGSYALPYRMAGNNLAEELMMCQRYYEKSYALTTNVPTNTGWSGGIIEGGSIGGTSAIGYVRFLVRKLKTPSITVYDTSGTINKVSTDGVTAGVTPGSVDSISDVAFKVFQSSCSRVSFHFAADSEL